MKKHVKEMMERFSFAQMTSNADGKTSSSGTMGVLICTVGAVCFLLGCIDKMWLSKDVDIITQSIIFTSIGAGLLGLRKYQEMNNNSTDAVKESGSNECQCPEGCKCGNCEKCQ